MWCTNRPPIVPRRISFKSPRELPAVPDMEIHGEFGVCDDSRNQWQILKIRNSRMPWCNWIIIFMAIWKLPPGIPHFETHQYGNDVSFPRMKAFHPKETNKNAQHFEPEPVPLPWPIGNPYIASQRLPAIRTWPMAASQGCASGLRGVWRQLGSTRQWKADTVAVGSREWNEGAMSGLGTPHSVIWIHMNSYDVWLSWEGIMWLMCKCTKCIHMYWAGGCQNKAAISIPRSNSSLVGVAGSMLCRSSHWYVCWSNGGR